MAQFWPIFLYFGLFYEDFAHFSLGLDFMGRPVFSMDCTPGISPISGRTVPGSEAVYWEIAPSGSGFGSLNGPFRGGEGGFPVAIAGCRRQTREGGGPGKNGKGGRPYLVIGYILRR
jgi:hypothetical protein